LQLLVMLASRPAAAAAGDPIDDLSARRDAVRAELHAITDAVSDLRE
jgi:hypothetical protein